MWYIQTLMKPTSNESSPPNPSFDYLSPEDYAMFERLVAYIQQTGDKDSEFIKKTCKLYGLEVEKVVAYAFDINKS